MNASAPLSSALHPTVRPDAWRLCAGRRLPVLARLLVAALLFAALPLRAELSGAAFEAANRLYEEGKFSEAAASYEKLIQPGQASAALFFNLGNAFFKSGQIGRAILAYRWAEELTPRDPDVRANLQFARNQAQGPTLATGRVQRWLGTLSLNEWTVLTAVILWALWLGLALLQWRPALGVPLRKVVLLLALAAVLSSVCLGLIWRQTRSARLAVVVVAEAVVRHGPLEESQAAFTAHDGAELRVTDQKDDWLQVAAGPRQMGWVRRNQVALLH